MILKILSTWNKKELYIYFKPVYITNFFHYDPSSKTSTETCIFTYKDRRDDIIHYKNNTENCTSFNLKIFPISIFFSDVLSLKRICDEYNIRIKIDIDFIKYYDFNMIENENKKLPYSIKYNTTTKPIKYLHSNIYLKDIEKISDLNELYIILNNINRLILKDLERNISFCRWTH